MKIISFIERRQSEVIEKILRHCGMCLPAEASAQAGEEAAAQPPPHQPRRDHQHAFCVVSTTHCVGPGIAQHLSTKSGQGQNVETVIRNFSGAMDEFCLFSRALNGDEIRALYSSGKPRPDPVATLNKN